jgi:putative peptidoglycan lipid II flippase
VVLGAGKFNWEDTMLTMDTLGFFTLSLFAQATIPLLVRVFYARHNSVIPFVIGVITVGLNTLLAWWLAPWLGVRGLALAYSIDNILNFLLLWLALHFTVGITNIKQTVWAVTKFVLSALMAGCAAQLTKVLIWPWIDMTRFFGVLSQLLVSGVVGLAVYLGFSYLLGSEELDGFLAMIGRRLPFNKVKLDDQGEARRI